MRSDSYFAAKNAYRYILLYVAMSFFFRRHRYHGMLSALRGKRYFKMARATIDDVQMIRFQYFMQHHKVTHVPSRHRLTLLYSFCFCIFLRYSFNFPFLVRFPGPGQALTGTPGTCRAPRFRLTISGLLGSQKGVVETDRGSAFVQSHPEKYPGVPFKSKCHSSFTGITAIGSLNRINSLQTLAVTIN